jgi:hypothetical protein
MPPPHLFGYGFLHLRERIRRALVSQATEDVLHPRGPERPQWPEEHPVLELLDRELGAA